jgi:C4-dicarboxylate-specific signal transduction histidine kinase
MNRGADWDAIAREEILFFGGICAAVSHEINNRLAVINERAGLLDDLAGVLATGKPVEPGRLRSQSQKILEQVRSARDVVRNLNQFAHSVDTWHASVDVTDLLTLLAQLYARRAANVDATLSVARPSQPVSLSTMPFLVENLIGRGIDLALAHLGPSRGVTITAEATTKGVRLRFAGLAGVSESSCRVDDDPGAAALLDRLGARLRPNDDGSALLLEMVHRELDQEAGPE